MTAASNIADIYSLSPMQESLLFHVLMDGQASYYFEQISYRMHRAIQVPLVQQALDKLCARHEALRTAFMYEQVEKPVQVVLRHRTIPLHYEDLGSLTTTLPAQVAALREADRQRGFNLVTDPLLRAMFVCTGADAWEVTWSFHHIILDGWSLAILNNEFWQLYEALESSTVLQLPPVQPYSRYINWLTGRNKAASLAFWQSCLSGYEALQSLPAQHTPGDTAYTVAELDIRLPEALTAALTRLALAHNVTIYVLTQVIWGLLLAKYNDVRDVVFGTVVAGRPASLPGVEQMIGLFINTLPLRIRFEAGDTLAVLLQQVKAHSIAADTHQYTPLAEIQSQTGMAALFDHILIFENYPVSGRATDDVISGLSKYTSTNYHFNMIIVPGECLELKCNYNAQLYDPAFMEAMAGHLQHLCRQLAEQEDPVLDGLTLITPAEREQVLTEWNNTAVDYPGQTVHRLFEEVAASDPHAVALVADGRRYTYASLNESANQLAWCLHTRYELQPGSLVAIVGQRNSQTIINMLAVLKCGGAYVPIDPAYPAERVQQLLSIKGMSMLLLDAASLLDFATTFEGTIIATDVQSDEWAHAPLHNLPLDGVPEQLAYLMFTSGTTGKPKGVMVEHKGIVRLIRNADYVTWHEGQQLLQTGAFSFDASTFEVWGMLLQGGTLHLLPQASLLDPLALQAYVRDNRINIMWFTAAWFNQLAEGMITIFEPLQQLLVGGDKLSPAHIHKVQSAYPHIRIINGYGPTENTTFSVCHTISATDGWHIPIGRPIANSTAYVRNSLGQLMPCWLKGMLYVGGDGVAQGYYDDATATAIAFSADPFSPQAGARLYRTGDTCRWLPGGVLAFEGRADEQVKIRGFRVEPGEVAQALATFNGVEDALVMGVKTPSGDTSLVAWYVAAQPIAATALHAYLQQKLPASHWPVCYNWLVAFPLNVNGKIDRSRLPPPLLEENLLQGYAAPETGLQKLLAGIWEEVLDKTPVGIHDNFFALGGHSLKAVQLIARLHKEANIRMELRQLFLYPTVAGLAAALADHDGQAYVPIVAVPEQEFYAVSRAQRRVWIACQLQEEQASYNIPVVFDVEEPIVPAALENAFRDLLERHESLRTTFCMVGDTLCQQVKPLTAVHFSVRFIDLCTADNGAAQARTLAQEAALEPFDLQQGPLLRVSLLQLAPKHCRFLLTLHHIVADFFSMQVLVREMKILYAAHCKQIPVTLPALSIQYKDYAVWHNTRLEDTAHRHLAFWSTMFAGTIPQLALPTDYPRAARPDSRGRFQNFMLDESVGNRLRNLSRQQGTTLFTTFLAAVYAFLFRYTGQQDLIIGTPVSGREHPDLEGLIGFFVNMIGLRQAVTGEEGFAALHARVKTLVEAGMQHQSYPFDLLLKAMNVPHVPGHSALFDVVVTADMLDSEDVVGEGRNEVLAETYHVCKYDLRFRFSDLGGPVAVNVLYRAALFSPARMQVMQERFISLLLFMLDHPGTPLDACKWEITADHQQPGIEIPEFNF